MARCFCRIMLVAYGCSTLSNSIQFIHKKTNNGEKTSAIHTSTHPHPSYQVFNRILFELLAKSCLDLDREKVGSWEEKRQDSYEDYSDNYIGTSLFVVKKLQLYPGVLLIVFLPPVPTICCRHHESAWQFVLFCSLTKPNICLITDIKECDSKCLRFLCFHVSMRKHIRCCISYSCAQAPN